MPRWCNGSHVCLRSICRKACRFESDPGYELLSWGAQDRFMCVLCVPSLFLRGSAFLIEKTVYSTNMSYSIEDIQGLMNDLSGIGLSRKSLVFKTHYGFGEDLKGENDGKTPLCIPKVGADLMQEAGFGKWVKDIIFKIDWENWDSMEYPKWTHFPVPSGKLLKSGLIRVDLFQSSSRMGFPGNLPPEKVKEAYEVIVGKLHKVRFEEEK